MIPVVTSEDDAIEAGEFLCYIASPWISDFYQEVSTPDKTHAGFLRESGKAHAGRYVIGYESHFIKRACIGAFLPKLYYGSSVLQLN